jgi:sn1-specific diacylglycerol lipase
MPALYWCFRRWRTGSDDFFWSGFVLGSVSLAAGIMAISRISDDGDVLDGCPLASVEFRNSFHGLAVVSIIAGGLLLLTGAVSARGRIFDTSKRSLVPWLLYLGSLALLVQFVTSCIAASRAVYHGEASVCLTFLARSIIRASIALALASPSMFIIMMLVSFDPSGRKTFDNEDDYTRLWEKRCNLMCCCFTKHASGQEAFSEAAKTMAVVFRGYDLVPSDIAAGMLLLQGYQTHRRYQNTRVLKFPVDPLGREEVLSSQARPVAVLSVEQRATLDDIQHFAKYYLGAYGWMLYTFMNVVSGLPKLCAADAIMCCRTRRHNGVEHHETCGCDTTAMKKITGLRNDEIILTSFENTIYRPCFYVAKDSATNSVVVAIRGTMSLEDCITDMVATPAEIMLDDTTNSRGWVHSGMLQSATNVLQILVKDGVLHEILQGRFATSNVVVVGHSLGAGTAAILSILLWTRYPALRNRFRCIAYAPPGGLLSQSTRKFCDSFMVGTVVGFDVIPRMSAQNFNHLRECLLAALTHTNASKAEVFCSCCCPQRLGERLQEFQPDNESSSSMQTLRRVLDRGLTFDSAAIGYEDVVERRASSTTAAVTIGPSSSGSPKGSPTEVRSMTTDRTIPLFPPLRMVHYVKMVRQGKSPCCPLTADGGGSLWTRVVSNEIWCPTFIDTAELDFVVCHPMMTLDHFPDRVLDVIESTHKRLKSGELDRFMQLGVTPTPRQSNGEPVELTSQTGEGKIATPLTAPAVGSPFGQSFVPPNTTIGKTSRYQSV